MIQNLLEQIEIIKQKIKAYMTNNPDFFYDDWNDPKKAYHNTRVLCDLAGLSVLEKNLICACIYQESTFMNSAVCNNRNTKGEITSSDWGIVQVNDHFHCGKDKEFPSAEYVVAHPKEAVTWMIRMYNNGLLKLWVSYSSGAYHRWLKADSPMWKLSS